MYRRERGGIREGGKKEVRNVYYIGGRGEGIREGEGGGGGKLNQQHALPYTFHFLPHFSVCPAPGMQAASSTCPYSAIIPEQLASTICQYIPIPMLSCTYITRN